MCPCLLANTTHEMHPLVARSQQIVRLPSVSSQHAGPMESQQGDVGGVFLSRLRMKLLIETGNKNNETTGSQKSKHFRVERGCREHLT